METWPFLQGKTSSRVTELNFETWHFFVDSGSLHIPVLLYGLLYFLSRNRYQDTKIFFQNKVLTVSCLFISVFCCPPVTQCICSGNFQFYIFHKPWPWLLLLRSYHCLWPYKILIPKKWYWFEMQEYIRYQNPKLKIGIQFSALNICCKHKH